MSRTRSPDGAGTENLAPLGEAGSMARLRLEAASTALPNASTSVAVNSLGLLDLVEIAAQGLTSKSEYRVYLAESNHPPFGKLEALAVLKINADGAGIVQAIGPLKVLANGTSSTITAAARRFLIVTAGGDSTQVVLVQASDPTGP